MGGFLNYFEATGAYIWLRNALATWPPKYDLIFALSSVIIGPMPGKVSNS
jgi:hypothetical protein